MLPPGLSYKRPFQLRPLFCLYASVSITGLQGMKTDDTRGLGHTDADLMPTVYLFRERDLWPNRANTGQRCDTSDILGVAVRNSSVLL